ncbi:MAG: protein translocase subunit SecD [Patescibacteria group bacterium]|nr:protein translocase subunit SecD [Patescibacteria group bacterium]
MKKFLKTLLIIVFATFIFWVILPEEIKEKYKLPTSISLFGINHPVKLRLGLDLQGGSRLVFQVNPKNVKKKDLPEAVESARSIIERRVNFFGVSEPVIQSLKINDDYRIIVELPGIENVDDAIQVIGKTAQLVFMEQKIIETKDASPSSFFLPTDLTGKYIKKASVTFSQETGKPEVALEFSDEGSKKFQEITRRNIKKPLAIFIDDQLVTAPIVQEEIAGGQARISGAFDLNEAKRIAITINAGALPVDVKLIEQKKIGPSLGKEEVRRSLSAGVVGLVSVLVFMIFYYGKLGVLASVALLIYGAMSLAIFKIFTIVLTLPGIAGFILSIGMAVDSNILIFERIKEELRKGKEIDMAVKVGFGRAIEAIKDANITTLVIAFILFNPLSWEFLPQFGLVRGFSLTLAIGVIISFFTGVFITKRLIQVFYLKKKR